MRFGSAHQGRVSGHRAGRVSGRNLQKSKTTPGTSACLLGGAAAELLRGRIQLLTGPRQVGKTTLLLRGTAVLLAYWLGPRLACDC